MVEWQTLISFGILIVAVSAVMFGSIWKIFDGRISKLEAEQKERVTQAQHDEFKEGLLGRHGATDRRLDLVESTRPHAETLKAYSDFAKIQLADLKERVASIEMITRAKSS